MSRLQGHLWRAESGSASQGGGVLIVSLLCPVGHASIQSLCGRPSRYLVSEQGNRPRVVMRQPQSRDSGHSVSCPSPSSTSSSGPSTERFGSAVQVQRGPAGPAPGREAAGRQPAVSPLGGLLSYPGAGGGTATSVMTKAGKMC